MKCKPVNTGCLDRLINSPDRPFRNPNNSVPKVPQGLKREEGSSAVALGFRETTFTHSFGKGMNVKKPE